MLRLLAIRPDGVYVDGTFGRGGHSRAILERLGPDGRLLALDRDPDAFAAGRALEVQEPRFRIIHGVFSELGRHIRAEAGDAGVQGILLDIGVSSPQLEDPARGFGFRTPGPLDMRMDPGSGTSAADWINVADEGDIAGVLRRYGEEPAARRIARAIVAERAGTPITTTDRLAAIIAGVVRGEPGRHPATRSFQAIRIHVNRELDELEAALAGARDLLAPGGRLCVISFHSLEDRIVKRFLRDHSRIDPALRDLPVVPEACLPDLELLTTRAVRAGADEIGRNPRARSAVLRAAQKRPAAPRGAGR